MLLLVVAAVPPLSYLVYTKLALTIPKSYEPPKCVDTPLRVAAFSWSAAVGAAVITPKTLVVWAEVFAAAAEVATSILP